MQQKGATITEKRIAELEKRLKAKSRELEIQASLENVRIIALAMKKPGDMPDVCRAISQQLESLGVTEIRNVQTAIICSEKGTYMDYGYFTKYDKCFISEVAYTDHPLARTFADQMLKGNGEIFLTHMKRKEVKDWLNYQKGTSVFIDPWLETATSLNFYWYPLGPVALGISTYAPLHENEIELFKRFRNVFELAYRRYLDIQRAEAQTREAQIQLALERVRAKTMAMQKSSELSETAYVLFQQFKQLGEVPSQITIGIFNEQERAIKFSITGANGRGDKIDQAFTLSIEEPTLLSKMYAAWKEQKKSIVLDISGQELLNWIKYRSEKSGITDSGPGIDPAGHRFICAGFFSKGLLTFSSNELLSGETVLILERFAAVFDQTYARFLDLQKAEVQAREAQIQLAMERVRAKTMSMQKPSEFVDVINVIGEQFIHLGFDFDWVNFSANGLDVSKAIDIWNFVVVPGLYQGATRLVIPFIEHPIFTKAQESVNEYYRSGNNFTVVLLDKKDKDSFLDHLFTNTSYKDLPEEAKKSQYEREVYQTSNVVLKDTWLSLGKFDVTPLTDEQIAILKRLANEFGQAYTRYLDLQKAEAQARESQIQLALERVRARTMAMHRSDELAKTALLLFQQLQQLGLSFSRTGFYIWRNDEDLVEGWTSNGALDEILPPLLLPYKEDDGHRGIYEASLRGAYSYEQVLAGKELDRHYQWLMSQPTAPVTLKKYKESGFIRPGKQYKYAAIFKQGYLLVISAEPQNNANNVLHRFAKVFEQTYTRFLDLQKAEAQAREAQIEAGLERVRSRAMAMKSSEELAPLIGTVFTELTKLDLAVTRCVIWIFHAEIRGATWWMAHSEDPQNPINCDVPYNTYEPYLVFLDQWEKRTVKFQYELSGETKKNWDNYLFTETSLRHLPSFVIEGMKAPERVLFTASFNNFGSIHAASLAPLSVEHADILLRFARVFDLTYTRFNDLKQAEAQAREAEIELALERVRARTMAMQHSEELQEVVHTVLERLKELNVEFYTAIIILFTEGSKDIIWWLENKEKQQYSKILIPYADIAYWRDLFTIRENGINHFSKCYSSEEKYELYHHLFEDTDFKYVPEKQKKFLLEAKSATFSVAIAKNSGIHLTRYSDKAFSENDNDILMRFAGVFEQSYTRFLDLQKAEVQAREAQIEASLERVRGKAMAMHNSNDVSAAASMVFTELRKLGIDPIRCGVGLLNKESRKALLYSATSTSNEDSLSLIGWVILSGHPVLEDIYGNWLKQEEYYPELTGTQLESYYKNLLAGLSLPSIPNWKTGEKQYGHFFPFSVGCLYAWSDRHYNESEIKILKRFAGIIDLTFRRFLDLQKAEAQAREAQIETALEKVRSRTLAMQKSDELADTSAVLFKQLIHLGIAPNRLYIGIIHDKSGEIEFWITDEDGSKVSSKFTGNALNNPSIKKMYAGWAEQRKWLVIDMHGKELREYFHYLGDELRVPFKGGLSQKRRIQYLAYFSKGFIGMASPAEQPDETVNLLERFAYVFNLTFTRFNDLQIAEAHALQAELDLIEIKAARKRAEDTLAELQETQRQLIQSEKMASLGELTAGIAHEIQNPLNFVNNFSEVSNELVDEMNEELDKGEVQEARLIAADIKQNLEKINHHGKRADAIVKGMLQHSRKSSGQKEPTDINILADEYLRLSYHGLRAKDKNFNATLETDFDNSIGKIPVIPQDIGRVLLNLFNNAFYAVNEQKSKNCIVFSTEVLPLEKELSLCEPTVSVSTKKSENHAIITVKDNGRGIPQKILDKIFQPFFTTKPTGQGTGLGLSLSYDIIKAHGGEIKVESKEGEGSVFIIQLPI